MLPMYVLRKKTLQTFSEQENTQKQSTNFEICFNMQKKYLLFYFFKTRKLRRYLLKT